MKNKYNNDTSSIEENQNCNNYKNAIKQHSTKGYLKEFSEFRKHEQREEM